MSVYLTNDAHSRDQAARAVGRKLTGKYHHAITDKWTGKPVTACSGLSVAENSGSDGGGVDSARWCRASGCRQRYEGGAR